jgi:hypothetical protein
MAGLRFYSMPYVIKVDRAVAGRNIMSSFKFIVLCPILIDCCIVQEKIIMNELSNVRM